MSYRSCYGNPYFDVAGSPLPAVNPVGTILTPAITALPLTQVTNTYVGVLGAGFTLPSGVWEVDCVIMTELNPPADATSATVNCISRISYAGVAVAQNDTGSYLAVAGATQDLFRGTSVSGAVVSNGTAGALQISINCETADGGTWGTFAGVAVGDSQYVRCVRIA